MKRLIFVLVLAMMLTVSSALAVPAFPHPVYGKITNDGYPVVNLEVRVSNLNTGVSSVTTTNDQGFYQVDLGNIDPRYVDGQQLRVSLVYCEQLTMCTKTVSISGGGNEVTFDTKDASQPLPDTTTIAKYVCWDGSVVENTANCPPQVTPPPVVIYKCADGTEVSDQSKCPETKDTWYLWVIGFLAAIFTGAGSWAFINGKFKHNHNGVTGYHDPNTKHTDPRYRHTLWKVSPLKCISDVKKIKQGIDLSKL